MQCLSQYYLPFSVYLTNCVDDLVMISLTSWTLSLYSADIRMLRMFYTILYGCVTFSTYIPLTKRCSSDFIALNWSTRVDNDGPPKSLTNSSSYMIIIYTKNC